MSLAERKKRLVEEEEALDEESNKNLEEIKNAITSSKFRL